jgi:predicted ATPase
VIGLSRRLFSFEERPPRAQNLKKIVITGGPAGGKTTLTSRVKEVLENKGVRVYIVPEVATMMSTAGCKLDTS